MYGVISVSRARIHKKEETKRLNNLLGNFVQTFHTDWLDGIDFSSDTDFQQEIVKNGLIKDVKKFLLATCEFGQEIHGEIDLYVTNDRLNEAIFRRKLDLVSKNIIKNQNSFELLFKDLEHFDTKNPVIENLIREIDIGKKKDLSKFLSKAPDFRDLEMQSRPNKLRSKNDFFNKVDNNNNNNNNNNNGFLPIYTTSSSTATTSKRPFSVGLSANKFE